MNIGKLGKFGKLQIFIKVLGSISGHMSGSHLELLKMAAN